MTQKTSCICVLFESDGQEANLSRMADAFDELVLVVNSGSVPAALRAHPRVKIISNPTNLGYAAAANVGVDHARHDTLVFLNPDVTIAAGVLDVIRGAVERYPDYGALAFGCCATRKAVKLDNFVSAGFRHPRRVPISEIDGDVCSRFAEGSAMVVRRQVFEEIGRFDEAFFMYFEDDDFSARLAAAKRPIIYLRDAVAHHRLGTSAPYAFADYVQIGYWKMIGERHLRAKYGAAQPPPRIGPLVAKLAFYGATLQRRRLAMTLGKVAEARTMRQRPTIAADRYEGARATSRF